MEKYKKILCKWTQYETYELIYESEVDGYTSRSINMNINGKRNVMILIVSDNGSIFGCFNSFEIPKAQKEDQWIIDDNDFFVFTLRNKQKTQPMKFTLKEGIEKSLVISPNTSRLWIIATHACFGLKQMDKNYIANNFCENYNCPSDITEDIFVGCHFPSTFIISKVYAIQWN